MSQKPWDGRFSERTDRIVEAFTASIDFDKRLYSYDIKGSVAHCKMLAKSGIISDEDASQLIEGLGRIKREIERGEFAYDESLEDIHMHIENRLLQQVGKVAHKLHTARSRNDQIALDVRMYLRDETLAILESLASLRKTVVSMAKKNMGIAMPGYTHLQRAQPVLLSHHLMAYFEMFTRDAERFKDALKRIDVLPLGSAALAGTTYPIDRQYTADLLGFPKLSRNSIDAVSDRDFILEFLSCASICMVHFSRLSEELILWSTSEFSYIELPDAFATGSSIMPQKKNPDVPELVRGKAGKIFGNMIALLTLMKALPLSYNRDMQEDKPPLFESVDILKACISVFTKMLPKIRFNRSTMETAASLGFLNATDLADYLVLKGMAFREAHNCAGKTVHYALSKGKELHEFTLEELRSFSADIEEDIFKFLTVEQTINRRRSFGGTAEELVLAAVDFAEETLLSETTN
jgi:argininosuccinate lyase